MNNVENLDEEKFSYSDFINVQLFFFFLICRLFIFELK